MNNFEDNRNNLLSPKSDEYDPVIWEEDLEKCDRAALIELHQSYKQAACTYKNHYRSMKQRYKVENAQILAEKSYSQAEFDNH